MPDMAAAVLRGPGSLTVERRETPTLRDGEVLVEVSYCGVCGSDIHMTLEGWGRPGSIGGHEWTGVVAAVGADVTSWRVGDAVVGGPTKRCGACGPCRAGRPALCEERDTPGTDEERGAFADYIAKPQGELLALPPGLDLRSAALAEPLAVALHGITRARLATDESVMVIGAGPIGQLALAALVARGWTDVVVVEPAPTRQDLARALGGAQVRHPDELDVPSIAEPDRIVEGAVDVVLECSGHRSAMEAGLAQLRRAGRLVMVGAGVEPPRFDPNRILLNELTITGSFTYDADGFDQALALLASGSMPIDRLLEPGQVPLSGLLDAMQRLARGEIAAKVLVAPGGDDGG
jgi:(R,R)-butanediol dehydrogenase/meso-butanediol dehydrogenase/diacetyl reductase